MESIAEFIVNNINVDTQEQIQYSVMQNGIEMGMELIEIHNELFKVIDRSEITNLTLYPENLGFQRKKVITFEWKGKKCKIGEHFYFCTQRDYFWVKISPVI
jgi:hypothetical protein